MIREDYVSFETAKLLKEKEFDEPCHALYHNGEDKIFFGLDVDSYYNSILNVDCYTCPTLQMAMKWLREVYNIGVFPSIYGITDRDGTIESYPYGTDIVNLQTHELICGDILPKDTYEEACETAIKYVLENLV